MRVRLIVIGSFPSVAERYDGAVIGRWHGKPVQHRRGPATVTGDVHRTRASARHWLAIASREGAAGSARKPGDLRRPQAHIDPRGKGLATHATHPFGPLGADPPGDRRHAHT